MDVKEALVSLIDILTQCGVLSKEDLIIILDSLQSNFFICGPYRMDHRQIAEALKHGPVLLECDRRRAYGIVKSVEKILGEKVFKRMIGRKSSPVYLLYREKDKGCCFNI